MKKILIAAILCLAPIAAKAQTIFWWDYPMNVGSLTTNINQSFSNLLSFVQGGYSNRIDLVGVTNQPAGTTFIVTNGTDRWLLVGTNDGGSGTSTPQSPWTDWIAGAGFGVSNAGVYNVASTNIILLTLGTNLLMVQGTASQPTNIAWNGNSLWNVATAGGGGGFAITNYLEISEGTNCPAPAFTATNGVWSFVMITNVARSSGNLASIYNGSTWDFNLPDSNRLYGISLEGDISSTMPRGLTVGIFINGTNSVHYPGHERLNTPDPSLKIFSGGINFAGGSQLGHLETRETQVGIKTNGTLVRVMILPTATFSFYSVHLYIRDLGPAPTYREPGGWSAGW